MFLAELCIFAPLAFGLLDARVEGPFTKYGTYTILHGLVGLASSGILKREKGSPRSTCLMYSRLLRGLHGQMGTQSYCLL